MTGKEALEWLEDNYMYLIAYYNKSLEMKQCVIDMVLPKFYRIKEDLEVLEIIKKHLTICGLSISCFIGGNRNIKETYEPKFNDLKEWLEND